MMTTSTDDDPPPVDHDALTQAGPTELGAIVETGPQLAYSVDTDMFDYPEPASRVRVGLIAAGIVAAAGLVVGGIVLVGHSKHTDPTPVAATPTVATTTVAPMAAPPPPAPPPVTITTVIVQSTVAQKAPPAPTPATPQWVSSYDQQLFNRLSAQGVTVKDYAAMARDAHIVCAHLANGQSIAGAKQEYAAASGGNATVGELFVSDVISIYPSCP